MTKLKEVKKTHHCWQCEEENNFPASCAWCKSKICGKCHCCSEKCINSWNPCTGVTDYGGIPYLYEVIDESELDIIPDEDIPF